MRPGWDAILVFGLQHKDCGAGAPLVAWAGPIASSACAVCGATVEADIRSDDSWSRYQALVTWGLRLCKNDRQQAEALAVYQKPLVCFCALPGALHVNDYQSADMLRRNL